MRIVVEKNVDPQLLAPLRAKLMRRRPNYPTPAPNGAHWGPNVPHWGPNVPQWGTMGHYLLTRDLRETYARPLKGPLRALKEPLRALKGPSRALKGP